MNQKTNLEVIATVIQSAAIVIGVVFGIHEFILKDREHDRQVVEITMKQLDRLRSSEVVASQKSLARLKDIAFGTPLPSSSELTDPTVKSDNKMRFEIIGRFDSETRDLAQFYRTTFSCIKTGYCKKELVQALVCEDARNDLDLIFELQGRLGNKYFHPTYFRALVDLQPICLNENPPEIYFP